MQVTLDWIAAHAVCMIETLHPAFGNTERVRTRGMKRKQIHGFQTVLTSCLRPIEHHSCLGSIGMSCSHADTNCASVSTVASHIHANSYASAMLSCIAAIGAAETSRKRHIWDEAQADQDVLFDCYDTEPQH